MIIELPFATPSNNQVMRMHHRERSRQHINNYTEVWAQVGRGNDLLEQCNITVTRHGSQFLDWDNMGGGLKFLLDALVKNRIIKDDNPKCVVSLDLKQEKCKRGEEKTVIELNEIDQSVSGI